MLSYDECAGFCDLSEDEIELIADAENMTEMGAMEWGQSLIHDRQGVIKIRHSFTKALRHARDQGDVGKSQHVRKVIRDFDKQYHVTWGEIMGK